MTDVLGIAAVVGVLLVMLWLLMQVARVMLVFLALSFAVYWIWGRDLQPPEQVCTKWDIVLVYPDGPLPYAGRPQRSCVEWRDAP